MATGSREMRVDVQPQKSGEALTRLRAECTRVARVLRERSARVVGLLPAGAGVALAPVTAALGSGLAELGGMVAIVVQAEASALLAERVQAAGQPAASPRPARAVEILAHLAAGPGAASQLRELIDGPGAAYAHLLVDLGGFDRLGEHLEVAPMLDGVVIVARRKHTTTRQLERRLVEIPKRLQLGILLTGT